MKYDSRHGSAYDRGGADAYYRRSFSPHYYVGATYSGKRITKNEMTKEEIDAYTQGYQDQVDAGDFKDWR